MTASSPARIPELPDPRRLTLPGGVSIEHLDLASVVQPALTPLMPAFDILNAVLGVFDVLKAIPDPFAIAEAIVKLAEKIAKLAGLIPQLSLPLTVVELVDLVIGVLGDARDVLVQLQERKTAVTAAQERAAELGDAALAEIAECAAANIEQEAANLGKRLGALGSLVGIFNLFLGMIGGPEVPDLSSIGGKPLDEVIEPLDALVTTLETVRSAIPLP